MKWIFFCLATLLFAGLGAQEKHFVFIQSDNQLPFYVSINGKLYSSSGSGYAIIPKLTDGTYKLAVGFAKNLYPEQIFTCVIDRKDLGYNLKNFAEKGWGLFNLQSLAVVMAGSDSANSNAKTLAQNSTPPANPPITFDVKPRDTAVIQKNVIAPAQTTAVAAAKVDTVTLLREKIADRVDKPITPAVKKVAETIGAEGVNLSYLENNADTINLTIPFSDNKTGKAAVEGRNDPNVVPSSNGSNCKNIATDDDYTRLRKKMASQFATDKIIAEAQKAYRLKCFTTAQIKKLSTLFLSDQGRYSFFKASYPAAADVAEFPTLKSQFIDPAFVTKFQSLLH